jgi:hypothetical protein
MKIPLKDLQGEHSDNAASSDSDQDACLPKIKPLINPVTEARKAEFRKILVDINAKIKKGEKVDFSKYPKLFLVHFRGTHFFKGFFSQAERRAVRQRIKTGTFKEPVYSPAVYELAGIKLGIPLTTEEQKMRMADEAKLLREKFKSLEQASEDSSWYGNSKIHDTMLYQHYQRYVNNYEEFRSESAKREHECFKMLPSKANPYVSTADEARHAVYYALGGKAETDQGCLRPAYTQIPAHRKRAKHPKTGYVQVFLHTLENIAYESPLFLSHLHATNKIDIKGRVLNERETTFKAVISEKYIYHTKIIRYPSFNVEYNYGYHKGKYGISDKSSYSRYGKALAGAAGAGGKESQTGLLEVLADHYGNLLTLYAHQVAADNGGFIVYIGLDGLLRESMPTTRDITTTRKADPSSQIDLDLEKFASMVISDLAGTDKLPTAEEILGSIGLLSQHEYDPKVIRDLALAFKKVNMSYSIHVRNPAALVIEVTKRGMQCVNVTGDGKCFYHAVLHQLQDVLELDEFEDLDPDLLIERAIDEILTNIDYYAAFSGVEDVDDFVNQLLNPGEWADHYMIQAVANALNLRIKIIRSDGAENDIVPTSGKIQYTIYLGYEVGWHYQSLKKSGEAPLEITKTLTLPLGSAAALKDAISQGHLLVNAVDRKANGSVMSWAIIEKIDILDFLFERKADPFIVSVKGRTPFHYACRYNQIAPVKKLLGYSRDLLNQQDFDGMTGLHLAIREGHKDLADFLIKQRLIRKELVNHEGQTVRDLATKKGWHDFVAKYCS